LNKRKVVFSFLLFMLIISFLSVSSYLDTGQRPETAANENKSTAIENLSPIGPLMLSTSDSWTYNDYIAGIEGIYDTFNYFNLSKYGGGWQYEVTREWTDAAFTNGKYIGQDAECIVGLLSAYNLTGDAKYLKYAEDIWNWDQRFFFDDIYGGYYVRLNQDNSIAVGDKGMFEHGWFGLATAQLYFATGNSTYLNQLVYIYTFVTSNFYDISDGSYYGALSRNLAILVSDVDTNWCAPYARFLMEAYSATGNSTYGDKAIELVDNLMNHAYDSQYGWIVNRVSSDWSSFTNPAKGWYDALQTYIDAYRVFNDPEYLTFAQTCFDDIQQANSTVGYLMEMNRDWTSAVNNELLGEEDPGTAIAYLRIANALQNSSILQEAYRYRDAIYTGLHDPVYGGIYRRIYSSGSQSTWKQWCGAGRVMEMLAEFASFESSDLPEDSTYEIKEIAKAPYGVACAGSVTNGTHLSVFGGENSGGRIDSILLYDIEKNSSTVISNQFASGLARSTAEYWDGRAYIFGGDDGIILDTIQIYNLDSGTLTTSSTHLPQPAKEIGSASNGTYFYLFGGFGASPERKITILGFDPVTEEIVNTGATLPEGLSQTTPVFAGDVVYIFGGHRYGGSAHTYILKYDPSLNTCIQITTTMPREISSMSAVWDGAESIFIFGGALDGYSGDTQYDTIYVFNTTSETITEHPLVLPVPSIFQMAGYVDGRAYIIGGRTGASTYLDDVVRFSPYQEKPWPSLKVTHSPLIPSQSQSVQVQVMTLSNLTINQSILSHTYNGETYTNASMSKIADQWIGVIPSYPAYTQVQYRVYVQNIIGEWAGSELYSYDVIDTEGPVISTSRDPIAPIHTQPVTINATVIDASDIDQVLLDYSSDNQETWTEVVMGQIGNNWIEVIPLFLGGTNVSYYVQAQDSEGNWGTSDVANYTVNDVQGPSIITMRDPQVPCIDDLVQVTAAVYDTSMVDSVWLMVRFNNGSWTNYEMIKISYLYFAHIAGQDFGTYVEYRVSANDTVGNWGISQIETYTVMDFSGPSISLLTDRSSAGQNEVVPIEVDVSDSGGVNQVLLCYSLNSGGTYTNISMGQHSGHWSASIPMGVVGEWIYFRIFAEDQAGNWGSSQMHIYQIVDVIAPNVIISIKPLRSGQSGIFRIQVEVTDDSDILSLQMRYSIDDWMNESVLLLEQHDGIWTGELLLQSSNITVQFRIVVEDIAHNVYESCIMMYALVQVPSLFDPATVIVASGGIGLAVVLLIVYLRKRP
jgi:hypothetical protein